MDKNLKYKLMAGGIVALIVVAAIVAFFMSQLNDAKTAVEAAQQQAQEMQLQNEQLQLAGEYEQLNSQYINFENQAQYIQNDSLLMKYTEAKDKVEKLLTELKTQKITSQKRITELQNEIKTLKNLMRHYVAVIDSLGKENEGLKIENQEIKQENRNLASRVSEETRKNANLSERMTLAEKLNITGLNLTALNKKGKNEKHVTKAKQLMVTFTIPQNNSTPVGEKTLYIRITSPEGSLLGSAGTFSFEGGSVAYTERKKIEYEGV
ncbi:MAG: hypothetical protein HUK12_01060, partial [Muribaculaceae bacterium]|nr:hypothetical protein [Muribaculaceae bacterium]